MCFCHRCCSKGAQGLVMAGSEGPSNKCIAEIHARLPRRSATTLRPRHAPAKPVWPTWACPVTTAPPKQWATYPSQWRTPLWRKPRQRWAIWDGRGPDAPPSPRRQLRQDASTPSRYRRAFFPDSFSFLAFPSSFFCRPRSRLSSLSLPLPLELDPPDDESEPLDDEESPLLDEVPDDVPDDELERPLSEDEVPLDDPVDRLSSESLLLLLLSLLELLLGDGGASRGRLRSLPCSFVGLSFTCNSLGLNSSGISSADRNRCRAFGFFSC